MGAVAAIAARVVATVGVAAAMLSCRPVSVVPGPDDPGIPTPPGEEKTVSVAFLKTLYTGAPTLIKGEYRISGAVVSSDDAGNFYKTLVLDDGTGGIEVKLDVEEIFKRFLVFSHVTVRCNGLWLGSFGGTLQLGAEPFDDYETQPLSEVQTAERLAVDTGFYGEVLPRTLTFAQLSTRHISTFVAFEGVGFADSEQGMDWTDTQEDPDGGFATRIDTNRHLVDAAGDTLIVRTGGHARFAAWLLPEGLGRIEGVLGYFNGDYQLVVCDSQKFYPQ